MSPSPRTSHLARWLPALCLAGASAAAALLPAAAQAGDVGVSVSVGQPGFYGRVDIGNTPPPVIYQQPVIIAPGPVAVQQRPIYLRVPPGHERNWGRYCGRYRACGQPVYFVKAVPAPPPRYDRHDRHDHRHDHGHRGHGRHDHGRHDHDHDRGPGRGDGHSHGHGRGRD